MFLKRIKLSSFRPDKVCSKLYKIAKDCPSYYSLKTFKYFIDSHKKLNLGDGRDRPIGTLYKILFVGDISFAESYGEKQILILKKKGYDYPLQKVKPLLDQSNFVICNLETPITNIKNSPYKNKKTYVHWTDIKKSPKALMRHNLRTFSLANNHTLDYGISGLEQTLEVIKENGLNWFGAGMNEKEAMRPLLETFRVGIQKLKVAVIGVFERFEKYEKVYDFYAKDDKGGCYMLSQPALRNQIFELKNKDPNTYVIVFPHWGHNYKWKNFHQTSIAHRIINNGADLVIGHGSHGIQEIEKYKGKWIFYGLGNFLFLSDGRFEKLNCPPYSYVAQVILADNHGKLEKWMRIYPMFADNLKTNFQPRPLNNYEFADFINKLLYKSPLTYKEAKSITKGSDEAGNYLQLRID